MELCQFPRGDWDGNRCGACVHWARGENVSICHAAESKNVHTEFGQVSRAARMWYRKRDVQVISSLRVLVAVSSYHLAGYATAADGEAPSHRGSVLI